MATPTVWRTLLGQHPAGRALRQGLVTSPLLQLDFADVAVPNKAFKRVVRECEFDVAELALMTFLMARSRGVPLRLLPVVLFARNPLPHLVCRAESGRVTPRTLVGRRIGVRAYTTTTAVWVRALLSDQLGVDAARIEWVTYEEGHVAGVVDPPNVRRDAAATDLVSMLLDGAIDAAIVDHVPVDPRIVPVVHDADACWQRWQHDTGATTINHVVVVRESIASDAERMAELFGLFRSSRDLAERAGDGPCPPLGFSANRRSLQVAIDAAESQHLLTQPLAVEDLM